MNIMEVKLREFHGITDNVIEKILRMRGVQKKNVGKYLFPDDSMKPDYKKLNNIEAGIDLLNHHINQKNHVLVCFDADYDGWTSGAIMVQYITKDLGYPEDLVDRYVPHTKVHGIPEDYVLETLPDLVIVPDAGSSDYDTHKKLANKGISTLVIDHHEAPSESSDAVVINNQLSPNFPNKGLTGANMAHLFCEAYSDKFNNGESVEKYLDLAFTGMIADRASLLDEGCFWYLSKGSQNIQNNLLKQLIAKSNNLEENKPINAKDVGWEISPNFNALTRSGKPEDIELVVDALLGKEYTVYNNRLKMDAPVVEESVRRMINTRNRQSKIVKEAMEQIEERIEEKRTNENKIIFVNATDIIDDPSITGLVATKIASNYKKPALILKYYPERNELSGSGRNFTDSPITSLKDVLEKTGLFSMVAGHPNAHGASIELDKAFEVTEALNELLADVEYDNLLHVADLRYSQKPDAREILEIAKHSHLWGEGLFEPVVHVEDIQIPKKDIKFIGQKGDTWKLNLKTCDAIMFKLTESQKLALTNHEEDLIRLSIVGECSLNTYKGQQKPQIIIKDFEAEGLADYEQNPWQNFDVTALPF